jgi:hypothetical protein
MPRQHASIERVRGLGNSSSSKPPPRTRHGHREGCRPICGTDSGNSATVRGNARTVAARRRMGPPPHRQRAGRLCPARKPPKAETGHHDDDRRATDWKHCIRGEAVASNVVCCRNITEAAGLDSRQIAQQPDFQTISVSGRTLA